MPACMHVHKSLARSTENVVGQPPSHTSTLASDLHFYRLIFSGNKKKTVKPGKAQEKYKKSLVLSVIEYVLEVLMK